MADDDATGEVAASGDPTAPAQRRATYTPPVGTGGVHDDDALADALAAEFARIASGPIPIVPPAEADQAAEPEAHAPTSEPVEDAPVSEPVDEAPVSEPVDEAPVSEPVDEAPAPEPAAEPPAPAWMNLPAPDPAQAVDLPEGPPQRPVRRSLPDDALVGWVDDAAKDGGTLGVIEELEAQLKLREEEAREFQAWEQTMRAVGTPDAISEVEQARPEFNGVLPADDGALAVDDSLEPQTEAVDDVHPEPAPAPIADEELYRPPTGWFIPAPIDDAPQVQFSDQATSAAAESERDELADGEASVEDEEEAAGAADADPVDTDPVDADDDIPPAPSTGAFVLPEQPLAAWPAPSWDVPAEAATQTDDLATDDVPVDADPVWNLDDVPPEPDAETEPEPEPEPQGEPEGFFLPEPAYEPLHPTHPIETISRGDRVEPAVLDDAPPPLAPPPFAPPPLVEPPPIASGTTGEVSPVDVGAIDDEPIEDEPVEDEPIDDEPVEDEPTETMLDDERVPSTEVAPAPFSFEAFLAGAPEDGEPVGRDPEPEPRLTAETLFIEPLPASASEPPVTTGSVTIIDQAYQEEIDDDVDETDRVIQAFGPVSVDTAGIAVVPPPISPPSGPISTVRIREDEAVLAAAPPRQRVFTLEASGVEPTPLEYRVGRAARLFWLWFASNSSLLSIGLGAAIFGLGLSLSQSVGAILAGVALSFIPLGLSTLAGKRSGQPTMIVSRATFGLLGNIVPAVIALVSRLFWGAVLLWFLATSLAVVLVGAELNGSLSERQLLLIGLAGGLAVAVLIAFFGYALLARIQLVITIVSSVLVIGLIALTWQYVDLAEALTKPYGSWELTVTGTVLVFSFVGLVWANSAGDLARYQRPESSGPATLLWSPFGVTVPAFVLIAYGALLAASNDGIASGFLLSPLDTLALMLPSWYPIPLLAATILALLSGVAVSLYSGGFALQAIGMRVRRAYSVPIVAVLLAGLTLVVTFAVPGGNLELFRDGATTLAVPVAAWAGIFAAEMMIRNRRFESQSLVQRGGVYPDVRWLNLIALVVITLIGFGLTTATITWLSWQGYLFGLLAVPIDSDLAGTDLGVIVALVLGLLVPIVAGIPGIRRQEATEV